MYFPTDQMEHQVHDAAISADVWRHDCLREEEIYHTRTETTEKWEDSDGQLHREDGPALNNAEGERWYHRGKMHRIGGPAWIKPDGTEEWCKEGRKHREDGPAVSYPDGTEEWWRNGRLHRIGGPASLSPIKKTDRTLTFTREAWFCDGRLHRDDGPAMILVDGSQAWSRNGGFHRDDGPAVIMADGSQAWFINSMQHREDGPALIRADGTREWFLNGRNITNKAEQWMEQVNAPLPFDEMTTVMFRLSFAEYFR